MIDFVFQNKTRLGLRQGKAWAQVMVGGMVIKATQRRKLKGVKRECPGICVSESGDGL